MIDPPSDNSDVLGELGMLQGAMVLGIGYQAMQSLASLIACTRGLTGLSAPRLFTYLGLCLVQLIIYGVFALRVSHRLYWVWKPSTIVFTRRVLWYAGSGMLVSTWVMQAVLYGSWPATPAAWMLIACVVLKLPHPLPLLTVAAVAQTLALAAFWNFLLGRLPKVEYLYGDPDGPDPRIFWRDYKAQARQEAKDEKLRKRSRVRW